MTPRLGFVGAGQLGEPMVHRLLDAGHEVLVCARRPELQDRLRHRGADVTPSVEQLASSCDILISCLFSDDQLQEIAAGPAGLAANMRPGAILVSHTTGLASTVETLAAEGLCVLDAPVSGTAQDIAEGRLTVLIGGPAEKVDVVVPLLNSYADPVVRTGDLGSALRLKLVNNALFAANAQLVIAAMQVVEKLGGEGSRLLEVLEYCSGGSRASTSLVSASDVDAFATAAGPFLRKDVSAYVAAAAQAGVDPGLLGVVIGSGHMRLAPDDSK
ncbi:NAD(P)-dependent oxidoreductase [Nocardia gamkensis]|uniref:NAD(P)-dependent oxidoreductase n=1 Tax=Nocardia gamkensis TaxID=352869 RepID=UPI0036EA4531